MYRENVEFEAVQLLRWYHGQTTSACHHGVGDPERNPIYSKNDDAWKTVIRVSLWDTKGRRQDFKGETKWELS
eukprot:scaffold305_cov110-Cylindrotheca_fusiformis.AAC.12